MPIKGPEHATVMVPGHSELLRIMVNTWGCASSSHLQKFAYSLDVAHYAYSFSFSRIGKKRPVGHNKDSEVLQTFEYLIFKTDSAKGTKVPQTTLPLLLS